MPATAERAHIVDRLIEERAPGLFSWAPTRWLMRHILYPYLGYRGVVAMADRVEGWRGAAIMDMAAEAFATEIATLGLYRLPRRGRVIIAPNHPTGLADGVAVWKALHAVREDVRILANRDAIRLAQGLADVIIPVEWAKGRRNPAGSRRVLGDVAAALRREEAVVLFPSGRIAYMTHRGLKERPWLPTVVTLARKFEAPVLPLHVRARNSWVFYAVSQLSTELRDVTLFHELMNKRGRTFGLTFGDLIRPEDLPDDPAAATSLLQRHVEHDLPRASRLRPRIAGEPRRLPPVRLPTGVRP